MKIYYDITDVDGQRVFPLERVRMVSAHEGVMAVSQGGDSLYKDVRVTKGDEPFVLVCIEEGLRLVEEALGSMLLEEGTYTDGYCEWTLKESYGKRQEQSAVDMVGEAVAIYALWRWLDVRLPGRAASYLELWPVKLKQAVGIVCEKGRPELTDYD